MSGCLFCFNNRFISTKSPQKKALTREAARYVNMELPIQRTPLRENTVFLKCWPPSKSENRTAAHFQTHTGLHRKQQQRMFWHLSNDSLTHSRKVCFGMLNRMWFVELYRWMMNLSSVCWKQVWELVFTLRVAKLNSSRSGCWLHFSVTVAVLPSWLIDL